MEYLRPVEAWDHEIPVDYGEHKIEELIEGSIDSTTFSAEFIGNTYSESMDISISINRSVVEFVKDRTKSKISSVKQDYLVRMLTCCNFRRGGSTWTVLNKLNNDQCCYSIYQNNIYFNQYQRYLMMITIMRNE